MKFNNQSGAISKILLILAVILLVVIIIVYFVIRASTNKSQSSLNNSSTAEIKEPPKPIYETTIGEVRFLLQSSQNLGNTLKRASSYEEDLTTTEKFIKVVIGAQNKGKSNVAQYSWDIGNVVDADGRNFGAITNQAYSFLPKPDLCGALLKPEFKPVPCVRIYEVSKISTNLKIEVKVSEPKKESSFIDLKAQ